MSNFFENKQCWQCEQLTLHAFVDQGLGKYDVICEECGFSVSDGINMFKESDGDIFEGFYKKVEKKK